MSTCRQCGNPLTPDLRFCTRCGAPVSTEPPRQVLSTPIPPPPPPPSSSFAPGSGSSSGSSYARGPVSPPTTSYVSSVPPAVSAPAPTFDPSSLRLAHGEVIKKVFDIGGRSRGMGWLAGHVIVTDSRIIYRAEAKHRLGSSRTSREMHLSDVNGLALVTRRGLTPLSLLTLIIGTLIMLAIAPVIGNLLSYLAMMSGSYTSSAAGAWTFLLMLATLGVAGAAFWVRWKSTQVVFAIFARSMDSSPISLSGSFGDQKPGTLAIGVAILGSPLLGLLRHLGMMDASEANDDASPETVQAMYDELGAMILDLQSRGVLGVAG